MLLQYVFVYIFIDVFCLIFCCVILMKVGSDTGVQREVKAFRGLIITLIVYLLVDATWALGKFEVFTLSNAAVNLIESLTLLLMGVCAYCWFLFAEFRMQERYVTSPLFSPLATLPIIIVAITTFSSIITGIGSDVNIGKTLHSGVLGIVQCIGLLLYLFYVLVHASIRLRSARSTAERHELTTLMLFIVFPIVCAIIDLLVPSMPVMAISVFSAVLLTFINNQQARINTDALTGLSNRRHAINFAENELMNACEGRPYVVYMVDIDDFKNINDGFGHNMGDQALCCMAEGLRRATSMHHAIAARWGGDEFVIVAALDDGISPMRFTRMLRDRIEEVRVETGASYLLEFSIGSAISTHADTRFVELLKEADDKLYRQKEIHHNAKSADRTIKVA